MKTFKDLKFKGWSKFGVDGRASMLFDNGYGVSVVYGDKSICKTNSMSPYELAVFTHKGVEDSSITILKEIGYLTEEKVTKAMIEVQGYSKANIK